MIEKHARSGLERISSEVQIELLAHGMSETALRLLEQLPKVQLMPTLTVPEVDAVLRSQALLPSRC